MACSKPKTLSTSSPYNVVSLLDDSTWFATGKAIRFYSAPQKPTDIQTFSLQITTDLPYQGDVSKSKASPVTGCTGECIPTQRLHLDGIPLKKGKFKLGKVEKDNQAGLRRTNYWQLIEGSGIHKAFDLVKDAPGWVKVTSYNSQSHTVEGQFELHMKERENGKENDKVKPIIFRQGLFRVKLEDRALKK